MCELVAVAIVTAIIHTRGQSHPDEPDLSSTTQRNTMIYFFESNHDLATRGGGALTWDGDPEEMWGPVNPNNISNGDIADIIEMIGKPASEQIAMAEEEYRDERDGSERLADRYGC